MLMGLSDVLALARTPEERDEIRKNFLRMRKRRREMRDDDIDFSDIPEVTDFSGFRPGKPYFDKMREHNLKIEAERRQREQSQQEILTK